MDTTLFDIDARAVNSVMEGRVPFPEQGAQAALENGLDKGLIRATTDLADVGAVEIILSNKLMTILEFRCQEVLCTGPYVADESLTDLDQVLERSDLPVVVGAPHFQDASLDPHRPVADIWGLLGRGVRV